MEVFTVAELVERLQRGPEFDDPEGPFVDPVSWVASPETASLYVFTGDEYEEEGGEDPDSNAPFIASRSGLRALLVISDLRDVILSVLRQRPGASIKEIVEAIDHYREFDDFKDFP